MSRSSSDAAPVAADALAERVKDVHRRFPTGVTIVTTAVDGVPFGLAVNAFASLSLAPPLVLVCVSSTSSTYPRLFQGDRVAVNILAHDQAHVARAFARSGGDKFRDVDWRLGDCGAPVLDGVSAHLELRIERRMPAGTHTIFIGRVLEAAAADRPPLVYLGGAFFDGSRLSAAAATPRPDQPGGTP